jgi:hypothetical protein
MVLLSMVENGEWRRQKAEGRRDREQSGTKESVVTVLAFGPA